MKVGQMWTRVFGPDLDPKCAERAATNKGVFESSNFKNWCAAAGVEVTKRQAQKWSNKKGAAYNVAHNIFMNGFSVPVV